jgi:hypothetical protein
VVQERERGTCSHVTPASLSAQLGDSQATTSLWRAARPRNRNLQTSTRPLTARLSTQRGRDDHRSPPEPIDPAGALLSPVDNRAWVKNTVPCRWTQQVVQYSSHLRQSSSKSLRPRGGRCSPSRRARRHDHRTRDGQPGEAVKRAGTQQQDERLWNWKSGSEREDAHGGGARSRHDTVPCCRAVAACPGSRARAPVLTRPGFFFYQHDFAFASTGRLLRRSRMSERAGLEGASEGGRFS